MNSSSNTTAEFNLADIAGSVFRQPPLSLNCAQAVLHGAREKGLTEVELEQFEMMGGGRAPAGMCGALYAAVTLAKGCDRSHILDTFKYHTGHTECRQIRKARRVSCNGCVQSASHLLESAACHNSSAIEEDYPLTSGCI